MVLEGGRSARCEASAVNSLWTVIFVICLMDCDKGEHKDSVFTGKMIGGARRARSEL